MRRSTRRPLHTIRYTMRGFLASGCLCRLALHPFATLRAERIPDGQLGTLSAGATFFPPGYRIATVRDLHFGYMFRFSDVLVRRRD